MATHAFVTASVITLFLSGQALALTVFDIIQLSDKKYSNDEIIALIQDTDSAFELQAVDIPRLMKLGISETVIQTMLKTVHKETGANPAASSVAGHHNAPISPISDETVPADSASESNLVAPAQIIAGGSFDFEPILETRSGHHRHSAVYLAGVRLLVLRDEGAFSSIAARADSVVRRLKQVASKGTGAFHPNAETGTDAVMFYGNNIHTPRLIMKVSDSDAKAYQRRSGRAVSPNLLAAYWSDLLSDYWSIVIGNKSPRRLTDLHEGEALIALHEQWKTSSEMNTARLTDAVQLMPREEQQHLLRLAATVPHDFLINSSHLAKQP